MPKITKRSRPKIPAIPPKPHKTKVDEAYERLGVTKEEVELLPKVTHILKELPGKIDKAIEYLRGSDEPDARKWLQVYDSIPITTRKLLPFEAFCAGSGLTTKRVLELVTGACFEQSDTVAKLVSKAAKPELIKRAVKFGMKEHNDSDRKMVLQHEGYAPVPKTQIINADKIDNSQHIDGSFNFTDNKQQIAAATVNVNQLRPNLERVMGKISSKYNERLGIGDGTQENVKQISDGDSNLDPDVAGVPDGINRDLVPVDRNSIRDPSRLDVLASDVVPEQEGNAGDLVDRESMEIDL